MVSKKLSGWSGAFLAWLKKAKTNLAPEQEADVNQQLLLKLNKRKLPKPSQLKQLPKFLSRPEKIQLNIALLILIASLAILGVRLYEKKSYAVAAYGGEYIEGLIGVPRLINPILATSDSDRDLVKLMFAGLMRQDENGELIADLAQAYTIDATQTVYTFELRDDIRWHDNVPIKADDIIFTINSIKNPDYKSPFRSSFSGVTVQKINDKTVQFRLESPFPSFLSVLTIGIMPEHLWYSIPALGVNLTDLNIRPVGSGPYQFKSYTRDSSGNIRSYILEAYHNYHLGRPYIKNLHLKFYPDFETAVSALQNKNIDGLIYLPKEFKDRLNDKRLALYNLQFPQYTAIFFNPQNNQLLANNDFRHALALGVNKQKILDEVIGGDGQLIESPILPGLLGYDPEIKGEGYDPEAAKEILENLGWKIQDGDTFRSKGQDENKEILSLKITSIDQSENVKALAILQENWQKIGINAELEIIARERIRRDIIEPRNYQALVFGQVINANSGPYPFWHSSQSQNPGLNLSVLTNRDLDSYLESIRSSQNQEEKIEFLEKFQNKLLELNFAIFLYNPTYTYPVEEKIKGPGNLKFINLSSDRFNEVHTWYIKTKRTLIPPDSDSEEKN